jgi:serine/threonine protein kinase
MFRGKNIWIIPLITALAVAGIGWWADGQLRRAVQQEIRDDLQTTLDANATALEIWMANQKRIALALAEEPRFKSVALEIFDVQRSLTNRAAVAEAARQLLGGDQFRERIRALGYPAVQLVNTNFQIIADSVRPRERFRVPVASALLPPYRELFEKGEPLIITPFKPPRPELARRLPQRFGSRIRPFGGVTNSLFAPPPDSEEAATNHNQSVMQVAVPIKNTAGVPCGALVLAINPDAEFTRILSVARTGDSGETFAFDAEGVMLSQGRFDAQLKEFKLIENKPDVTSALNLKLRDPGGELSAGFMPGTNSPLIHMVERAISGDSDVDTNPFRDYRGVPVVGAWRWLGSYGFGIGTKLDGSEAYRTLRMVRSVFLVLFLLLLLASLIILMFSYSHVLWRRKLTEAHLMARQLGQYRLADKIGEGGMGSVYRARHALLRRETALKLLPPDRAEPHAIERFEQEVQLTCRLAHPNTIQVFDYGHTPDGIFYYAMEFIDGLNLTELVARYGPLPEERVIHIVRQVCGSLGEAHGLGLIHRDIKPGNIFVTDRGGVPDSVKVLDFGLVRHFGPNATNANLPEFVGEAGVVGTPNFIAPESIRNPDAADARSDIYSVGVLAYFLLTGEYLFEGATIAEVCEHHINDAPATPGQRMGREFDPGLEAVVMRCLEKDPAHRPQSAAELDAALGRCAVAQAWTTERRTAWWQGHRHSPAPAMASAHMASSSREKTVKIDIGDRAT